MQRLLFALISSFVLAACAAETTPSEDFGSSEEALVKPIRRRDPCAYVRCAAGTHCVAKNNRATCEPAEPGWCGTDADCRLYSDYCGGCSCDALGRYDSAPTCSGTLVNCFVDPCRGYAATCEGNVCVPSPTLLNTY